MFMEKQIMKQTERDVRQKSFFFPFFWKLGVASSCFQLKPMLLKQRGSFLTHTQPQSTRM